MWRLRSGIYMVMPRQRNNDFRFAFPCIYIYIYELHHARLRALLPTGFRFPFYARVTEARWYDGVFVYAQSVRFFEGQDWGEKSKGQGVVLRVHTISTRLYTRQFFRAWRTSVLLKLFSFLFFFRNIALWRRIFFRLRVSTQKLNR